MEYTNSPCEYCNENLPKAVDKYSRQVRSAHFETCEVRLAEKAQREEIDKEKFPVVQIMRFVTTIDRGSELDQFVPQEVMVQVSLVGEPMQVLPLAELINAYRSRHARR